MLHRGVVCVEQLAIQVTRVPVNQHAAEIEYCYRAISHHGGNSIEWMLSATYVNPSAIALISALAALAPPLEACSSYLLTASVQELPYPQTHLHRVQPRIHRG